MLPFGPPSVKIGTVTVAEMLLAGPEAAEIAPQWIVPLQKVSQAGGHADLARRAKAAMERANGKAGK
jgi:hypothetical protein